MYQQALGDDHEETAITRADLGACLTSLGRYAEAETLLLSSHATLTAARDPQDADVRETADRLIRLYERWGQPGKAAAYRS